jgi:hypothetical protein
MKRALMLMGLIWMAMGMGWTQGTPPASGNFTPSGTAATSRTLMRQRTALNGTTATLQRQVRHTTATTVRAPQVGASSAAQGPLVLVTPKGECYHRSGCQYARTGKPVTLAQAVAAGRKPCSFCFGHARSRR